MKKTTFILLFLFQAMFSRAQVLGGYTVYGFLQSAVHPMGCSAGFVTHLPDDSIWVNFASNDSMTGTFSLLSHDAAGADLLLETGFNLSSYSVSLLLINGQYSAPHTVNTTDWVQLANTISWKYIFTNCTQGTQGDNHLIVALDFGLDFGLLSTDTVTGIKIIFLSPSSDVDFAGAYIISDQEVGIQDGQPPAAAEVFPVPFDDHLTVHISNGQGSQFMLYDVTSRKIAAERFAGDLSYNTKHLANGIYFYEIWNEGVRVLQGKTVKGVTK